MLLAAVTLTLVAEPSLSSTLGITALSAQQVPCAEPGCDGGGEEGGGGGGCVATCPTSAPAGCAFSGNLTCAAQGFCVTCRCSGRNTNGVCTGYDPVNQTIYRTGTGG